MANLVSNNIGKGKVSRCSKTVFQFIGEREVNINIIISGTIKRPCC